MTAQWSDTPLSAGTVLPERGFGPQTHTDIVRYQGASGDFNPIHHDPDFARAAGMPGVFSVGMLQAGYLGTYCADLFGPESVRRISVRFAQQVWPGDELTCRGVVSTLATTELGQTADVDLTIGRTDGDVAVTATATILLSASTDEGTAP